jgi:hypothetical protein
MSCGHSENELALYVEGDLPPDKASDVDVHLVSCAVCLQVVEELRETQSAFKSIKQEPVSPQALAQLRTHVLGQLAARNSRPAWGRWVYALAGMGFVVAVAVGVVTRYRHPQPVTQQAIQHESAGPQSPPFQGGVARSASPIGRSLNGSRAEVVINEQPLRPRLRRGLPSFERRGLGESQPQKRAEPPKEIMVKLLTDDPNVVIYWLVDENGGGL